MWEAGGSYVFSLVCVQGPQMTHTQHENIQCIDLCVISKNATTRSEFANGKLRKMRINSECPKMDIHLSVKPLLSLFCFSGVHEKVCNLNFLYVFKYFQRSTEFCPLRCFCHSVNCILSTGRALISWGVDGTLMTLHWLLVLYPMHPMLWSLCNKWPSSYSANGEKTLAWLFLMIFTICFASSKPWVSLTYL